MQNAQITPIIHRRHSMKTNLLKGFVYAADVIQDIVAAGFVKRGGDEVGR